MAPTIALLGCTLMPVMELTSLRGARELAGHDVGVGVESFAMHLDGHNDLFERGVACALAQAVDGALDLRGAVLDGIEGKGGSHAQVVVRMHGDGDVLDAVDALDAGP